MSVVKNLMTLIGYNMSAKWDGIRSENLIKSKLTTTNANNRILTWLTANPPGFGPKTHQPSGFEGRDKPGAQLVGFEQATTINTPKIGKYT